MQSANRGVGLRRPRQDRASSTPSSVLTVAPSGRFVTDHDHDDVRNDSIQMEPSLCCIRLRHKLGCTRKHLAARMRYWVVYSLVGKLTLYALGGLITGIMVLLFRSWLGDRVDTSSGMLSIIIASASQENLWFLYLLVLVQLCLNIVTSLVHRTLVLYHITCAASTPIYEWQHICAQVRAGLAHRALDSTYWVSPHPLIQAAHEKMNAILDMYGRNSAGTTKTYQSVSADTFSAFYSHLKLAVQYSYSPITGFMFTTSTIFTYVLMGLHAAHNLDKDGTASIPFVMVIGTALTGFLVIIGIIDRPMFNDGRTPRLLDMSAEDIRQVYNPASGARASSMSSLMASGSTFASGWTDTSSSTARIRSLRNLRGGGIPGIDPRTVGSGSSGGRV